MASRVLRFRITQEDYLRLRSAAQSDALPLSTVIRFAVADWLALDDEAPPPSCSSLCPRQTQRQE